MVIGGGFIGLEMVENFVERGFKVTLLQRSRQVMPPLDYDMATFVHSYLRSKGVDLRFGQKMVGFVDTDEGVSVSFEDGSPERISSACHRLCRCPSSTGGGA